MSDYESISKAATPRPYHIHEDGPNWIWAQDGSAVAKCYGVPNGDAHAALLNHCVNHYDALKASHDELVEALEAMRRQYDFDDVLPSDHPVVQARAALARARALG